MEIRVDENGILRLESNTPLSAKIVEKIEKRLENKKATLEQLTEDFKSGKFDDIFKTL